VHPTPRNYHDHPKFGAFHTKTLLTIPIQIVMTQLNDFVCVPHVGSTLGSTGTIVRYLVPGCGLLVRYDDDVAIICTRVQYGRSVKKLPVISETS
jgi:hypothetical protein